MDAFSYAKQYKKEILFSLLIIFIFLVTRLYHLGFLPIFTDEAIYIRWAQIAKQDAAWRFISLTDGKQPLFIWLAMIALKFFQDPLIAARLVSVGAGSLSLIGIFFVTRELFRNRWMGLTASLLYVVYPMAIVYDKMALYDSLVGSIALWSLYFTILLVRKVRFDIALVLGMVFGAGVLNKTTGFIGMYLLPVSLLLFHFKNKHLWVRFGKWVVFAIASVILANLFYSILRLSPFFHIISEKNALFVYPLQEWIKHPFDYFLGNWSGLWNWFITYMTWPMLLGIVFAFIISKTYSKEKIILVLWFLAPFMGLTLFGNNLYPRYIFFMTLFLLPLIAYTFWQVLIRVKRPAFSFFCFLVALLLWLITDYFLLFDFAHAPIPYSEVAQYNNDWPSGAGVKESIAFFREQQAKHGKIFIATQGTFGLMPYAYELYLANNPNFILKGIWPIPDTVPPELLENSKIMPTYIVFYQHCSNCPGAGIAPPQWNIDFVFRFNKEASGRYLTVYQVLYK